MVSFAVNPDVLSRVGAQINKIFRGWHETHRRNTISVKTNGSKTNSLFEKAVNITSTS